MMHRLVGIWAALFCYPIGLTTLQAQNATAAGIESKMGTVTSAKAQALEVTILRKTVTATLAAGGRVWKKSIRQDFSAIAPGDRVLMRGRQDPSGTFIANEVWANIVSFHGHITDVRGQQYEVRVDRSGAFRTVRVDPTTLGERAAPLSPRELRIGRGVQTIGLELPDGSVEATRVIPDRTLNDLQSGGRVVAPDGRPYQR